MTLDEDELRRTLISISVRCKQAAQMYRDGDDPTIALRFIQESTDQLIETLGNYASQSP